VGSKHGEREMGRTHSETAGVEPWENKAKEGREVNFWERRPVQWVVVGVMACQTALRLAALILLPVASILVLGARHPGASAFAAGVYVLICSVAWVRAPAPLKQVGLAFEWLGGTLLLFWMMTGFDIDVVEALSKVASRHRERVGIFVLLYVLVFLAAQAWKRRIAGQPIGAPSTLRPQRRSG